MIVALSGGENMNYNRTKAILRIVVCSTLIFLFFVLSCVNENKKILKSSAIEKSLNSAIEAVIGMEFKGLEINGANKIFEKYKRIKIEIIQRAFRSNDFSSLIPEIKQITKELNQLTINKDLLRNMEEDGIKNYYIREFNNSFMQALINASETGCYIDIAILKTIYAY